MKTEERTDREYHRSSFHVDCGHNLTMKTLCPQLPFIFLGLLSYSTGNVSGFWAGSLLNHLQGQDIRAINVLPHSSVFKAHHPGKLGYTVFPDQILL